MTEEKTEEMVRVRVAKGKAYCPDEMRREFVHQEGAELLIPRSRVNHTVEVLDKPKPTIQATDPDKGEPQHRMMESPRRGGRK